MSGCGPERRWLQTALRLVLKGKPTLRGHRKLVVRGPETDICL
jgi:hypothetical protein